MLARYILIYLLVFVCNPYILVGQAKTFGILFNTIHLSPPKSVKFPMSKPHTDWFQAQQYWSSMMTCLSFKLDPATHLDQDRPTVVRMDLQFPRQKASR